MIEDAYFHRVAALNPKIVVPVDLPKSHPAQILEVLEEVAVDQFVSIGVPVEHFSLAHVMLVPDPRPKHVRFTNKDDKHL